MKKRNLWLLCAGITLLMAGITLFHALVLAPDWKRTFELSPVSVFVMYAARPLAWTGAGMLLTGLVLRTAAGSGRAGTGCRFWMAAGVLVWLAYGAAALFWLVTSGQAASRPLMTVMIWILGDPLVCLIPGQFLGAGLWGSQA